MAPETPNVRIERKIDELTRTSIETTAALGEIRQAIEFQAKQTAQVNELVKDKVGRVERALDEEKARLNTALLEEKTDRKAAIIAVEKDIDTKVDAARQETASVKATLGKIAMALFVALLSVVGSGILWLVTR